ncbi:MAG: hypothetical protein ACRBDL_02260 [Alphaproteobacteria bacterium]
MIPFAAHSQHPTADKEPVQNKLSYGHYVVDQNLVKTANKYGATITIDPTQKRSQRYNLSFDKGNGGQDFSGGISALKRHLSFLHQPVRTAIENAIKDDGGKKSERQPEREKALSVFRFISLGSAILPRFEDIHEDDGDHSSIDNAIAHANMWRNTSEIDIQGQTLKVPDGNLKLEPATIPYSHFHPDKGFGFFLSSALTQENENQSHTKQGNALKNEIWAMIKRVKGTDTVEDMQKGNVIYFDTQEMQEFCTDLHQHFKKPAFNALLEGTQHEERVRNTIAATNSDIADPDSPLLKSYVKAAALKDHAQDKLSQLKWAATSALTPILQHDVLEKRRKHYKVMERKETPLQDLQKDMNVLSDVITHYQGNDELSQMHIDAILANPDFIELISFEKELANVLQRAVKKMRNMSKDEKENAIESFAQLEEILGTSSTSKATLNRDQISEDRQAILDVVERSLGIGDDGIVRVAKDFVDNTIDFTMDIVKTPFKSVDSFVVFSSFVLAYHYYTQMGGDPQNVDIVAEAVQDATVTEDMDTQSIEDILAQLENDSFSLDDVPSTERYLDTDPFASVTSTDPTACKPHIHKIGPMTYQHCLNSGISGTSQTFANIEETLLQAVSNHYGLSTEETSEYFKGLAAGVTDSGTSIAKFNVLQSTAGHYPLIGSLGTNTLKYGPKESSKQVFGSFNDFFNSTWALAVDKPQIPLALIGTIALDEQVKTVINEFNAGNMQSANMAMDLLTQSAIILAESEKGFALPLTMATIAGIAPTQKLLQYKQLSTLKGVIGTNARAITDHLNETQNNTTPHYSSGDDVYQSALQAASLQEDIIQNLPEDVREIHYPRNPVSKLFDRAASAVHSLGSKAPKAKPEFHIAAHNLTPTIEALDHFDDAMNITMRHLGEEDSLYHTIVHNKVERFKDALLRFQNDELSLKEFKTHINKDLNSIMAAQSHIMGSSDIYSLVYNANISARRQRDLDHKGKIEHSTQGRVEQRDEYREQHVTKRSPDYLPMHERNTVTHATHDLMNFSEKAQETLKIGKSYIWGGAVKTAQSMHRGLDYAVPNKTKGLLGLGAAQIGLAALSTTNTGAELLNPIYQTAGYLQGVQMNVATFGLINAPDDIFVAHGMLGGAAIVTATALFLKHRMLIQPSYELTKEMIRDLDNNLVLKGMENKGMASSAYVKLKSLMDKDLAHRVEQAQRDLQMVDEKDAAHISITPDNIEEMSKICIACGKCEVPEDEFDRESPTHEVPIAFVFYQEKGNALPEDCELAEAEAKEGINEPS